MLDVYFHVELHRVVKLSSPNLNYLIIIGAALLFLCVYLYNYTVDSLDKAALQTVVCNVRQKNSTKYLIDILISVFPASTVVVSHWVYSVFCCDPFKDMENLLHTQQSHKEEKGMCLHCIFSISW